MPVPTDAIVSAPDTKTFALKPADVYQVQIVDISMKESKGYQTDEMQKQFFFKFRILDEGLYRAEPLFAFTSLKWFNGGKSMKPSKLFAIFTAVYGFYNPKVNLNDWNADLANAAAVNDLIGKQLRVTTVITANQKEKVETFMSIKKELPAYEEGEEEYKRELEKTQPKEAKKEATTDESDTPF